MNFFKNLFTLKKLRFIVITILLIYLAHLVTDIFWFIFSNEDKKNTQQIKVINNKNITSLPNNIFGKTIKKVKRTYKEVKKTKLNLTLTGIIKNSNKSFAIIRAANNVDKIYKVGDKINSSTSLKIINNNFIIINHQGRDEKLTLKFKINQDFKEGFNKEEVGTPSNKKVIVELKTSNKNKLKKYLLKARVNPASVLSIVAIEPNFVSGLLNGFKIHPSKERNLFFKMGFKSGDIITKINDTELNSLIKAFNAGKELSLLKTFDFVISRKNQEHYIHIDLN